MNKQDWTYKKLGEVATFINGYPFKPSDWKDSGRKIIRIQNLNNPNAVYNFYDGSIDPKYLVSNGDVLISWSGSLGVFEWAEDEAILNQHIFKVVFNKEYINKKFFQYVVASRINEMKSKVHGVTMQHITKKEFDIILIPVPPIGEQERIVAELDLLQGIIEKKKEQLKAYDQLAQSIFYTMFGDPITNEKGWEPSTIGDCCILKSGNSDANNSSLGTLPYVKVGDMNMHGNETYINTSSTFVDREENKKNIFPVGTTIFPKRGGAILTNKKRITNIEICCDLNVMGVIPNQERLHPLYIYFYFLNIDFVIFGGTGSTIPQINNHNIAPMKIAIPPLSLQQEFAEKVEAIERQKALVQQSIVETQTMFDYTMDKYFG